MPGYAQAHGSPAQQKASARGAAEHGLHNRATTGSQAPAHHGDSAAALNESPQAQSLLRTQRALDDAPRVQSQLALQRALNRRGAGPAHADTAEASPQASPLLQSKPNATGLPDRLKAGVEQLSGLAMDDVRVHTNSPKPAAVQAHAYAQGTDIHLAPGQQKHLPHEAWHVVQQKQGRVKPTLQMKGVAINDDTALAREADVMARQAAGTVHARNDSRNSTAVPGDQGMQSSPSTEADAPADVFPDPERTATMTRPTAALGTVQRIIRYYKTKEYKDGAIPKALPHKAKKEPLEALSKSPTVYDLDTVAVPAGQTLGEVINALGAAEGKDNKTDYSKQHKAEWVKPLLAMKLHIAGETSGKGGHLLKLMEAIHTKERLYLVGDPDKHLHEVWQCQWSLLKTSDVKKGDKTSAVKKGNKDTKGPDLLFPLKASTMFPASWTWEELEKQLYAGNHVGDEVILKNNIAVHSPGDTFYPKL
jgi:hypothetical protein